jgi:hypothetical protein
VRLAVPKLSVANKTVKPSTAVMNPTNRKKVGHHVLEKSIVVDSVLRPTLSSSGSSARSNWDLGGAFGTPDGISGAKMSLCFGRDRNGYPSLQASERQGSVRRPQPSGLGASLREGNVVRQTSDPLRDGLP